jgi:uncharacterized protein YdhG (YjbR/CyaY superfamily)
VATAFSKEERAAMRATAAEAKAAKQGADLEAACVAAIAGMTGTDRMLAETLHELIAEHTSLKPKTWYGMPAYIDDDGKVVVFFQNASKFNARYATIGFQEAAHLDEGALWPTSYAVTSLEGDARERVVALLRRAVS